MYTKTAAALNAAERLQTPLYRPIQRAFHNRIRDRIRQTGTGISLCELSKDRTTPEVAFAVEGNAQEADPATVILTEGAAGEASGNAVEDIRKGSHAPEGQLKIARRFQRRVSVVRKDASRRDA